MTGNALRNAVLTTVLVSAGVALAAQSALSLATHLAERRYLQRRLADVRSA